MTNFELNPTNIPSINSKLLLNVSSCSSLILHYKYPFNLHNQEDLLKDTIPEKVELTAPKNYEATLFYTVTITMSFEILYLRT
jgi:hypothetical protein